MSDDFIQVGDLKRYVNIPFKKAQLIRLSTDELIWLAQTYKPRKLKSLLIEHIIK
jgi:hypothetical protein